MAQALASNLISKERRASGALGSTLLSPSTPGYLPSPRELSLSVALPTHSHDFIMRSRKTVERILMGEERRTLLIVGPCSIHNVDAAYEYAVRLAQLAKQVRSTCFIIMRTYFEKARTALGWKGLIYDPHLDGSSDIALGVRLAREFLVALAELELPAGAEVLELSAYRYFSDLLSWGCIGARTVSSQPHRAIASHLPFPIGFKNTTDGNLYPALSAIVAAQSPHALLDIDMDGRLSQQTSVGNPLGHLVLRGGESHPNYDKPSLDFSKRLLMKYGIASRLIVDCSHDNCRKEPKKQIPIAREVMGHIAEGNRTIAGLMLESYLEEGSQPLIAPIKSGCSITDPCLGWQETQELIQELSALIPS